MTTLIAWLGVDSRSPSSLYLAADSRFSWGRQASWDYGRKLFASKSSPVMLGYCGDVLFASHGISQALDHLESGSLHPADARPLERVEALSHFLQRSMSTYPESQRREFAVLFAMRIGSIMQSSFYVARIHCSHAQAWTTTELKLPERSGVIDALGSGKIAFDAADGKWNRSEVGSTSRAVYSAFCDHVASGADPATGGAPQLVGLYRANTARTFGVIHKGRRWISGAEVTATNVASAVEWRDDLFQNCDANTMKVLTSAQRHARPSAL